MPSAARLLYAPWKRACAVEQPAGGWHAAVRVSPGQRRGTPLHTFNNVPQVEAYLQQLGQPPTSFARATAPTPTGERTDTADAAAAAEPPPLLRVLVLDGVYNDAAAMFRHLRKRGCAPPHVGLHPSTLSVYQHGQSAPLAVPEVLLGSRASSGRAWQLWLARCSQGRGRSTGLPATTSGARASRLQSRPVPRL